MNVQKFGGTSVGTPSNMHHVSKIVNDGSRKVVVLSAMSGTTNALVEISDRLKSSNLEMAAEMGIMLHKKYTQVVEELLTSKEYKEKANKYIAKEFEEITNLIDKGYSLETENILLSKGELLSTHLVYFYQKQEGYSVALIPALEFMCINEEGEPQIELIRERIRPFMDQTKDVSIVITQGFICRDHEGKVSNLKRGGSDYSASLIGAAVDADMIEIWTDIDGMHNNDPRYVEGTAPIRQLSFDEAAELAYFGAKILHPFCIFPAQEFNIPVLLKNTMEPTAEGTFISKKIVSRGFKAVAAKDNITAIKIKSSRMLMAYGFLRKVFEIFDRHRTPIDMITTSEVAVSLTIDNDSELAAIVAEIETFASVEIDANQTIICIVGNVMADEMGMAEVVTNALKTIPIRMISYGGSEHNISLLINGEYKTQALNLLHQHLFKA
ncbi:aspartate kinase [Alistipes sp. ZOR0009]|uniref:aspartate kinase n=1 Tax=Alistipes sp. ZOR0009 TaxID=1339253 RepID=UPI000645A6D5|nr:aspartate kinase [Alistipes sp. ZOR0009]